MSEVREFGSAQEARDAGYEEQGSALLPGYNNSLLIVSWAKTNPVTFALFCASFVGLAASGASTVLHAIDAMNPDQHILGSEDVDYTRFFLSFVALNVFYTISRNLWDNRKNLLGRTEHIVPGGISEW